MRRNVGSTLYMLANFYAVMNETVRLRLLEAESHDTLATESARRQLEKTRNKLFVKCQSLISTLRLQSTFEKWDINLGGQFPRQTFADIIEHLQSMLNHTALVSLASLSIAEIRESHEPGREKDLEWLGSLRRLSREANLTTQQITTLLSVLSSSISNEQPLPPYLAIPEPWLLSERLDKIDKDLLSVRHIAEPGYASFAVIQIGTRCLSDDLRMLMEGVRELVGELDFSLSVVDRV